MPRLLVCAATRAERDACDRGIRASLLSASSAREVLLTGVGPVRAARRLADHLAHGPLPDVVVSSGFAGALSATLARSSWITGVRVREWNGAEAVTVQGVDLVLGPPGLVPCDVLSWSALGSRAMAMMADGATPLAVDMESAALAREARRRGVAFAVVRMISDTPAHPLPSFLSPIAAALSATTVTSRVTFAGRAFRGAIADPRGVVRLARESTAWLRDLEEGWQKLASWPST